jgi:hypothetical protein
LRSGPPHATDGAPVSLGVIFPLYQAYVLGFVTFLCTFVSNCAPCRPRIEGNRDVTVEIEKTAQPALVAQWLSLCVRERVPRRSTAAHSTAFRKTDE